MKHKVLFAVLSVFFLFSCTREKSRAVFHEAEKPLTPVRMQKDTTAIVITDYIVEPEAIDSIGRHPHYQTLWNKNRDTLLIVPGKNFQPVENLRIYTGNTYTDIPLFRSEKRKTVFRYRPAADIKDVRFKSQITGWQAVPMQQRNGAWEYETYLDPGGYQYLFVTDGKEILDPQNPVKISNGLGGFNSLLKIPGHFDERPFLQTVSQNGKVFTVESRQPVQQILVYAGNQLLPPKYTERKNNRFTVHIPGKDMAFMRIFAYNDYGKGNDLLIPVKDGKVVDDAGQLSRRDFHTQIMYFLMTDRFKDGNPHNNRPVVDDMVLGKVNFQGGDLQGVLQVVKNGYFDELGVNTLWISPILQNPEGAYGHWERPYTKFSGYHGYWPVSNIRIDRRFGDSLTLVRLGNALHKRNMNLLLDYVANHVHKNHPVYQKHPDWFTPLYLPDGTLNVEKWDSHRLTTWFDTFLPTFDFSRHEVVKVMTDSAVFWLKNYPVDGFRHDATKHIPEDYWRTLTLKIKKEIRHPVFQIGETYGSPALIGSYVNSGMLDGQFDFNLYDAATGVLAGGDPVRRLADALRESLFYYGHHHLMGNISGNQDRVRFISYASGDVRFDENGKQAGWDRYIRVSDTAAYGKLEMLHAFNMFIPGIPVIYYGDEFGMPGANDPDNRRMMRFKNDWNRHEKHLFEKVKRLTAMRKNSMALLYGTTEVEDKDNVLIIKRQYFDDKKVLIMNLSDKPFVYGQDTVPPGKYLIFDY